MGAPESNAGDDFHFWWAASRVLALVEPGAELRLVALEGLASVDDPDDSYETVDVAEYFGGSDVASAHRVVASQLKYSTVHPESPWTVARICQARSRKQAGGKPDGTRSVIADLADAYRRLLADHGPGVTAKVRIALVSNQRADPLLVSSVTEAAGWVVAQGKLTTTAALLKALGTDSTAAINKLSRAIGNRLTSEQFCKFLTVLDLSSLGELDRVSLARAVRANATGLTPGRGGESARKLFELVRSQALPGVRKRGIDSDTVLAELGVPELADLYPAPAILPVVADPFPVPSAKTIAESALANPGRVLVVHGPAGAGKTTTLRQVPDHLPDGSVQVLFDCFGAGDYLSSGEERHTPPRFAMQVINELAQRCGTQLLLNVPQNENDLWRLFNRTLERAVETLEGDGILVLAVDAADNSVVAAQERGDHGFLQGLIGLRLPDRVSVVLTARTHRVSSLGTTLAPSTEVPPFDLPTSSAHLRRSRPGASDAEVAAFHERSGGNPRAQFYTIAQAQAEGWAMPELLAAADRTPSAIFADLVRSALQVSGADAGGLRWLSLLLALSRPVSTTTLAAALDVDVEAVLRFAAGLAPGVKVADDAIQFRDEDFETYVRGEVDSSDVAEAHSRLADMFLRSRSDDPDGAANVADHLFAAGRRGELLDLVLSEVSPVGIPDGFRREQVQGRRLDLAVRSVAGVGDVAAAVRLAVRGSETASRRDSLSRLVDSRLDLVARFTDIELLADHALHNTADPWLGPVLMRLAAALARRPDTHDAARSMLKRAEAWLRRWAVGRDDETSHWDITPADVASSAEALYRLDGLEAAVRELRRWRPAELILDAIAELATRIGGEVTEREASDLLRVHRVPLAAQAPVLVETARGETAPDKEWIDAVVDALVVESAGEVRPWRMAFLDLAIRFGDRNKALGLARHWSVALPTGQWEYSAIGSDGVQVLRCHAVVAALAGEAVEVDALIPPTLRPPDDDMSGSDRRDHDRREWLETATPIVEAAVLAARAAIGDANADEVQAFCDAGLATRTGPAQHRWFTYDWSYRAWSVLVAEAAIDTGTSQAVLRQLADQAPALRRDGAPELMLDLAETVGRRGGQPTDGADLCLRAADAVRSGRYSAVDRLELMGRAAEVAARLMSEVGRQLFDEAVDTATSINDDAARVLAVHASLANRASVPPTDRSAVARRMIRYAEDVGPHVTDSEVVPYEAIVGAAARLDASVGLAAVSRWDDEDRVGFAATLVPALTGAVEGGEIQPTVALVLDHLVENNGERLGYQLEIARHLSEGGAAGVAAARLVLNRAADWIRRRVPARSQPVLAKRLLAMADSTGLADNVQTVLGKVASFEQQVEPSSDLAGRPLMGEIPADVQALLDSVPRKRWRTLADDINTLSRHLYGSALRKYVEGALLEAPVEHRVDALAAVAALPARRGELALEVLADCLGTWRGWPGVSAWAKAELPRFLEAHLAELAWWHERERLLGRLRAFDDDAGIRQAILIALPTARTRLTAQGWQTVAALLTEGCDSEDAAGALAGLLDELVPVGGIDAEGKESADPVTLLLWSIFGHPRRAMRWRAAHAARELLTTGSADQAAALMANLMGCLDNGEAGSFRAEDLHFYRLSAVTSLLIAVQRVAAERPEVVSPHLTDLVRHATSKLLPHVQIRELARMAALAVGDPLNPAIDDLRFGNQPTTCRIRRGHPERGTEPRRSSGKRYQFDPMDTLPYWYAPLARVFDIEVKEVTARAESWILDRWGLGREDWMADARELRDAQNYRRMNHRQGIIPPEENLRLYLEYHALMTAAGELVDAHEPMKVGPWEDEEDRWQNWLGRSLPSADFWMADLATPVPAEEGLMIAPVPLTSASEEPQAADYDRALGLIGGTLPEEVVVAASIMVGHSDGGEETYVRTALVRPEHAADLQQTLAAAGNPTDWKLPDEDDDYDDYGIDRKRFDVRGWLTEPDSRNGAEAHDPYAYGMRMLPLPGRGFREGSTSNYEPSSQRLLTEQGRVLAYGVQWSDPSSDVDDSTASSSGYRVHIDRSALLDHLTRTGMRLIVEVQLRRHRSDDGGSGYRAPTSRIYVVTSAGTVIGS